MADQKKGYITKRRLHVRIILWVVVVLMIAALFAVAFLPRWIPQDTMRQVIAEALGEELGRDVEIVRARWRWSEGLTIEGLRVSRREEFAPGNFLTADEVNIFIQPWQLPGLLWDPTLSVESITLRGLEVALVCDENGMWNIDDLMSNPLPRVRRFTVAESRVSIEDRRRKSNLAVSDITLAFGRFSNGGGYVNLAGALEQSPHPAGFRVDLYADMFDSAHLEKTQGRCKIDWGGVDLARACELFPIDLGKWVGRSSGSLGATLDADGNLLVSGAVDADGARWQSRAGTVPARIGQAGVVFNVRYSIKTHQLDIPLVNISGGGLHLTASGKLLPQEGSTRSFSAEITSGEVSWDQFKRFVGPAVPALSELDVLAGRAAFTMSLTKDGPKVSVTGEVDLEDTILVEAGRFNKGRLSPLKLALATELDLDTGQLSLTKANLTSALGKMAITGGMTLPEKDAPGIPDILRTARLKGTGQIDDVRRLPEILPFFGSPATSLTASGPVGFEFDLSPQDNSSAATLSFRATDMRLDADGGEIKAPGVLCEGKAEFLLPFSAGDVDVQHLEFRLAESRATWSGSMELPLAQTPPREIRFDGNMKLTGLERLADFFLPALRKSGSAAVGGDIVINDLTGKLSAETLSLNGTLDATSASLTIAKVFAKPAGLPAVCKFQIAGRGAAFAEPLDLSADFNLAAIKGKIKVAVKQGFAEGRGPIALPTHLDFAAEISTDDLDKVADIFPAAGEIMVGRGTKVRGPATLKLHIAKDADLLWLSAAAGLTDATLMVKGLLEKPAGMEQRAELELSLKMPPVGNVEARLKGFRMTLGPSAIEMEGKIEFAPGLVPTENRDFASLGEAIDSGEVSVAISVEGRQLGRACPLLEDLITPWTCAGPAKAMFRWSGAGLRNRFSVLLDARGAAIRRAEKIIKPAGMPGRFEIRIDTDEVPGRLTLAGLDVQVGDGEFHASGLLDFDTASDSEFQNLTGFVLKLNGKWADVTPVATIACSAGIQHAITGGGLDFDLALSHNRFRTDVADGRLALDDLRFTLAGRSVALDGLLDIDADHLTTRDLRFSLGDSEVVIRADIDSASHAPKGTLDISGPKADLNAIQEFIIAAAEDMKRKKPEADGRREARRLLNLLKNADISGTVKFDELLLTVPDWETEYSLQPFGAQWRLSRSRLDVPEFHCGLNDGTVKGAVRLDFAKPSLPIYVDYLADLKIRDNLKPLIDRSFPGMTATGTLTQTRRYSQKLSPARGESGYPIGIGTTVIREGIIEGKSAPDYILKLFPGLEFTKYGFKKMTGHFVTNEDGSTDNDMIYDGKTYDIFMFGKTKANGMVRYSVGIDLSLSLGSKALPRDSARGKVPLMDVTGRIEGTKWIEQKVRYRLPHEVALDVFVQRSLFLKLLRQIGKPKGPDLTKPPYNLPSDLPKFSIDKF